MSRMKRSLSLQAGELNLTAMIDVAFQLLSFFVITMKPTDVLAMLDVSRPSTPPTEINRITKPIIVGITILPDNMYLINGCLISKENLDNTLTKLGSTNPDATVIVSCTMDSSHGKMVEVLDLCAKAKLISLSVVTIQ